MSRKASIWVSATVGVAVVAGTVVFLAVHSLSDANSWSSIGGFLTALVTVVVSVVVWMARRPGHADGPARERRRWRDFRPSFIWGNHVVFHGDGQSNNVVIEDRQRKRKGKGN